MEPSLTRDQAAASHTSCKVKSYAAPQGKIVFNKPDGIHTQMNIVNSTVGYSAEERQEFFEMIQVLQAEKKLGDSGFITISALGKM